MGGRWWVGGWVGGWVDGLLMQCCMGGWGGRRWVGGVGRAISASAAAREVCSLKRSGRGLPAEGRQGCLHALGSSSTLVLTPHVWGLFGPGVCFDPPGMLLQPVLLHTPSSNKSKFSAF